VRRYASAWLVNIAEYLHNSAQCRVGNIAHGDIAPWQVKRTDDGLDPSRPPQAAQAIELGFQHRAVMAHSQEGPKAHRIRPAKQVVPPTAQAGGSDRFGIALRCRIKKPAWIVTVGSTYRMPNPYNMQSQEHKKL